MQGGGGGLGCPGDGEDDVGDCPVRRGGGLVTGGTAPSSSCSAVVLHSPGGARESGERVSEGRGERGGEVRRERPRVEIK